MKLNVFFASSERYVQHFTVAAVSLLENNRDIAVSLYVIHEGEAAAVLHQARAFLIGQYAVEVNLLRFDQLDPDLFDTTAYYGKYTFFRLFLADIATPELDKILFMDVDMVVTGSLRELAAADLSGYGIAAVSETSVQDNLERLSALGTQSSGYFNAGLLLVNLKFWREHQLSRKFLAIALQHQGKLVWADQDILNIAFADSWLQLSDKFNGIHIQEKCKETPLVVHYNTTSKPWHYVDTHPYKDWYWKYLAITPFKGYKPEGISPKNIILRNGRLLKRGLRNMGLIK